MSVTLEHNNGSIWVAAKKRVAGLDCYVLSNKNPLGHLDRVDGSDERGNEERFEIHCPDERSVINGLQSGLSIRMIGPGNNGKVQNNLFKGERILIDGIPVAKVAP